MEKITADIRDQGDVTPEGLAEFLGQFAALGQEVDALYCTPEQAKQIKAFPTPKPSKKNKKEKVQTIPTLRVE